jgi:hypothetical protein
MFKGKTPDYLIEDTGSFATILVYIPEQKHQFKLSLLIGYPALNLCPGTIVV